MTHSYRETLESSYDKMMTPIRLATEAHEKRCSAIVTWKEGDTVTVDGKVGIVKYVYTNGFTLVAFPGEEIKGGIFNNNSTFGNDEIVRDSGTDVKEVSNAKEVK